MSAPEPAPALPEPGPPKNYLDLYGLSKPPFDSVSDNAAYILFGSHRRAFELLIDHLVNGSGMILLQGDEGIGKTETLRAAAAMAAETGLRTVMVPRPQNGRITLAQLISALAGQPRAEEAIHHAIAHFLEPPRKALLADDLDLMPADCIRLLLSMTQLMSNNPGGPAIVLSTSSALPADPKRPELSELASLARNIVRLTRLGAAEIRQYIERSLWIAGGTTRRLITADALRLLVSRSGGLPATTNRLMDAALTAGFARGDPMITAKTVATVLGPAASRHRPPMQEPSGLTGHVIQLLAIGLLLAGAAAFLYKGLTGQPDHEGLRSPKPATTTAPPVAATTAQQPRVLTIPPELIAALVKHGDQALGLGDIAAARLWYQRAAEAGSAAAATALGKTYDPNYAAPGTAPDFGRAVEWYQRAVALGDPYAADILRKSGNPRMQSLSDR